MTVAKRNWTGYAKRMERKAAIEARHRLLTNQLSRESDGIAHSQNNRLTGSHSPRPEENLIAERPRPGMPLERSAITRIPSVSPQKSPLTKKKTGGTKQSDRQGNEPRNNERGKVIQYIRIPPPKRIYLPSANLTACSQCRAMILKDCMDAHFASCHSLDTAATPASTFAKRLPFVLLPPGTWSLEKVVDHYRHVERGFPATRRILWSRIEDIVSLKPTQWYTGDKSWTGYSVFEFAGTNRVVLECPIENNATYILAGDWRKMVCLTKQEIRKRFTDCSRKLVHKDNWLNCVRRALGES